MNNITKCLVIYIFILLFYSILSQISRKYIIEKFDYNRKITYITKDDCYKIFNNSNYIKNFNKKDLKVRKCTSIDNCINNYYNSIVDFSPSDKKFLENIISLIDEKTKKYTKFNLIEWKFIKLKGNIENKFPFTLENVIFLNEIFFTKSEILDKAVQTLFHEKLHIFQRYNEYKSKDFYTNLGFSLMNNNNNTINKNNVRSNPDLYSNTYYIYKGYIIYNQYNENPVDLQDINIMFDKISGSDNYNGKNILNKLKLMYNINIEHPNEIFATIIPLIIFKNIKFDDYFTDINIKIDKYLN